MFIFTLLLRSTIRRIQIRKGRIGRDVDIVVFMPLDEIGLLQIRVGFELVDGGLDGGAGDEVGELEGGEVGDADVADFGGGEEGFHGVPCLGYILLVMGMEHGLETYVKIVDGVFAGRGCYGPVHEV